MKNYLKVITLGILLSLGIVISAYAYAQSTYVRKITHQSFTVEQARSNFSDINVYILVIEVDGEKFIVAHNAGDSSPSIIQIQKNKTPDTWMQLPTPKGKK